MLRISLTIISLKKVTDQIACKAVWFVFVKRDYRTLDQAGKFWTWLKRFLMPIHFACDVIAALFYPRWRYIPHMYVFTACNNRGLASRDQAVYHLDLAQNYQIRR